MLSRNALLIIAGLSLLASSCDESRPGPGTEQGAVRSLDTSGWDRVIINLKAPADVGLTPTDGLPIMQDAVARTGGSGWIPIYRYRYVTAMAGYVSALKLEELRRHRYVASIQQDRPVSATLQEAIPLIGVDRVRSLRGLTGKGVGIAVLDSGISTTNEDFTGGIVAQKCFVPGGCLPGRVDQSDLAEDDNGHGSNVAGISAGRGIGRIAPGVAPAADIVAVKVLNKMGTGTFSDIVQGLEFVFEKRTELKIKVINISIGGDNFETPADCDAAIPATTAIIRMLTDAGVTVFASSGNNGSATALSVPSCITGVISVGATFDEAGGPRLFSSCRQESRTAKAITCFTNLGGTQLDVLAPGSELFSASTGTGATSMSGTSQASPMAAGVAALMLECNPGLKPREILNIMRSTGELIEATNGRSYPLIRAVEAVDRACGKLVPDGGVDGGGPEVAPEVAPEVMPSPDVAPQVDARPDVQVDVQPDLIGGETDVAVDAGPDVVAVDGGAPDVAAPAIDAGRVISVIVQCEVGPNGASKPGLVSLVVGLGLTLSALRRRRRSPHRG